MSLDLHVEGGFQACSRPAPLPPVVVKLAVLGVLLTVQLGELGGGSFGQEGQKVLSGGDGL